MTKSALQIARAAYQPKVPAALKGAVKVKGWKMQAKYIIKNNLIVGLKLSPQ